MNTAVEQHPLQKQIDEVVADVRSGETTVSCVAWRFEQALMSAEIEMQALSLLGQSELVSGPVSTNGQVIALVKKHIELAEQGRRKAVQLYQDESKDRSTRIEALYDLKYYGGQKQALRTLLDAIEVRDLAIVAMATEAGAA